MADAMDDAFADDDDEVRGGCWSEGLLNAPPTTSSAYFVYEACLAGTFDEEESILGAVLAELGVEVGNKIADTPSSVVAATAPAAEPQVAATAGGANAGADDLDAELQKRLDNLRRT
eukprot:scaffold33332_cov31-Tisochrysis_lutea.AAC.4